MSNPNVIIHGRDPENRHLGIRTDDQGYLETKTIGTSSYSSITYDLDLLATTMYADSINSAIVDPYGRDGWYWTNGATTGASNCYWYSNTVVPQNHMTKAQIESTYVVIALDRVEPTISRPFLNFYSAPTGTDDHIPGFAHSVWTYTIPSASILNAGEIIVLVAGSETKITSVSPDSRRILLELTGENGECGPNELIDYISLNTDSGLKDLNAIQYLLQNAGMLYSVTNKVIDYQFSNSNKRLIESNLAGTIDVNIVSGGTGGGLVQIQGYSGTDWANLTSTGGALNTTDSATTALNSKINSATEVDTEAIKVYTVNSSGSTIQAIIPSNPTVPVALSATTYNDGTYDHYPLETYDNALNNKIYNSTLVDTEAIKVYTVNSVAPVTPVGTYANVHTGALASSATSTPFNINNLYLNETVLTYEDTSTSLTSSVSILVSNDGVNYVTIGTIQPAISISSKRTASAILKMSAFTYVYIQNNNTTTALANVVCSLFSA